MRFQFKWLGLSLAVAFAALGLVACGGTNSGEAAEGTTPTTGAPEAGVAGTTAEQQVPVESAAADLRVTLDRLLGEHALLATFAMQKGFAGEEDFKALAGALDQNTVDLGEAIGSVYGDEAEQQFLKMWRDHISFFVDFTVATGKDDQAARKAALDKLAGYRVQFADFLDQATGGELPSDAASEALQTHVDQLTAALDQYAAGDYEQAYQTVRDAYAHMFMTGDTLADGIVNQSPEEFASNEVSDSAADLRVALGRLLGEHVYLATVATQKGYSGSKDFEQIAAALDANSVELSEAIGSVYGDEAGAKFLDGQLLWRDHIAFFVNYTVGLAKKDKAMQDKAVGNLKGYVEAFSGFLAEATGLPQDALRGSITEHVNQLKGQIDAYAAADYAKAYSLMREAYAHMYMTGDTLADAIVKQTPQDFSS